MPLARLPGAVALTEVARRRDPTGDRDSLDVAVRLKCRQGKPGPARVEAQGVAVLAADVAPVRSQSAAEPAKSSSVGRTNVPTAHADTTHRQHAIIETVFADLIDGPLAHIPSGHFGANSAWILCAAIAHNLLRAAGILAGGPHASARAATLRRKAS